MPIPIAVLGIADLLMHLELAGIALPAGLGWRLAIVGTIALVTAIGGWIIPAFTRNWMVKRGQSAHPAGHRSIDRIALAALHTGLFGWAFLPTVRPIGGLVVLAALLNLLRLARWRGLATVFAASGSAARRISLGRSGSGIARRERVHGRDTRSCCDPRIHRRRDRNNGSGCHDACIARPYGPAPRGRPHDGDNLCRCHSGGCDKSRSSLRRRIHNDTFTNLCNTLDRSFPPVRFGVWADVGFAAR
jgi:hypothetical protein